MIYHKKLLAVWVAIVVALVAIYVVPAKGAFNIPLTGGFMLEKQNEYQAGERAQLLTEESDSSLVNCRYGISPLAGGHLDTIADIGAGWYLNFGAYKSIAMHNLINHEFVHVISIKQEKDGVGNYLDGYTATPPLEENGLLRLLIQQNRGSLWIVGNEVDRGPNPGGTFSYQGDTFPEMYARAYYDTYHFIKQIDPTAQISISALVQVTPGRLQYLDKVWAEYKRLYNRDMPVDVWNIHLYILPESLPNGQPNGIASIALGTDPALGKRESGSDPGQCALADVYCYAEHDDITIFAEQVVAMRQWMKNHGQQNKPLLLSEYSLLYPYDIDTAGCFLQDEWGNCFTPGRVSQFMRDSFAYLESATDPNLGYPMDNNRLVQQWLWYGTHTYGPGRASNLLQTMDDPFLYTEMGTTYKSEVAAQPLAYNLRVVAGYNSSAIVPNNGFVTATIGVEFLNNGNTFIDAPFTVTFKDLSGNILDVVLVEETVFGCTRPHYRVEGEWANLGPGVHKYTATVDSAGTILESNEADNIGIGQISVNPYVDYLPMVATP